MEQDDSPSGVVSMDYVDLPSSPKFDPHSGVAGVAHFGGQPAELTDTAGKETRLSVRQLNVEGEGLRSKVHV